MRILVTGGAGFIGSHCVDAFIERGDSVVVLDSAPRLHESRSYYVSGDLADRDKLFAIVKDVDLVVHAAGMLGTHELVSTPTDAVLANVVGTINVLDAVVKYGKKVINISKPNVWLNTYSVTKDCAEKFCFMYVEEFGAEVSVLKLYNVYGPRQKYSKIRKAIPFWIVEGLRGNPVDVFGSGESTIDLVHTTDVSNAILAIADHFDECRIQKKSEISSTVFGTFPHHDEQILELGSGSDITVNAALKTLQEVMDVQLDVRHLPMRRGEIDGTRLCSNNARLFNVAAFSPTTELKRGLMTTVDYYRDRILELERGYL